MEASDRHTDTWKHQKDRQIIDRHTDNRLISLGKKIKQGPFLKVNTVLGSILMGLTVLVR